MKDSLGDKIFYTINNIMLTIIGLLCLLPILNIIAVSFSSEHAVNSGSVGLLPVGFSLNSYEKLIKGTNVVRTFQNSVLITVVGILLSVTATIIAAYPLSKRGFFGRKFFAKAVVFTMLFSGGIIPTYLVIRQFGFINHYTALWIPSLVNSYNLLVMKTFFENIPLEMEESAKIDGCGEFRLLLQIVLPLSVPVIATMILFYGVGYWNVFMPVLMYMNNPIKYNLTVLIQQMILNQELLRNINANITDIDVPIAADGIKAAGIVIILLPMMVVYPFVQKHFVKGVMLGAVKG